MKEGRAKGQARGASLPLTRSDDLPRMLLRVRAPSSLSGKETPAVQELQELQETGVPSLGREDPLEEGVATHSSVLAWRTPRTEEPGGLQSVGWQ